MVKHNHKVYIFNSSSTLKLLLQSFHVEDILAQCYVVNGESYALGFQEEENSSMKRSTGVCWHVGKTWSHVAL